jgi:MFS family permease
VLVRTADLAQLVAVSAFLYLHGGFGDVAAYDVVRAIVPALGVPVVASATRRHGRGRVLRLLAFTAALASSGVLVVLAASGPVPIVLALAALIGVAIGSFRPITSALVPSLVSRPEELVACSASAGFLDGATTVCGPLLAGALLGVAGPAWGRRRDGAAVGYRGAVCRAIAGAGDVGARLGRPDAGGCLSHAGPDSECGYRRGARAVRNVRTRRLERHRRSLRH